MLTGGRLGRGGGAPLLQGVEWSGEWGVQKQQDCGLPEGLVGTPLWVVSAKNDDPIHGKLARPRCPPPGPSPDSLLTPGSVQMRRNCHLPGPPGTSHLLVPSLFQLLTHLTSPRGV